MVQKNKDHTFIVVLCGTKLIWVEDISNLDQRVMWAVLKGEEARTFSNDFKTILLNIKTHPALTRSEIYSITTIEGVKKSTVIEMFDADPIRSAETIRILGHKIYSGCIEEKETS